MDNLESVHSIFLKYYNLFLETGMVDTEDLKIEIDELNLVHRAEVDFMIEQIESDFSDYLSSKDKFEINGDSLESVGDKTRELHDLIEVHFNRMINSY